MPEPLPSGPQSYETRRSHRLPPRRVGIAGALAGLVAVAGIGLMAALDTVAREPEAPLVARPVSAVGQAVVPPAHPHPSPSVAAEVRARDPFRPLYVPPADTPSGSSLAAQPLPSTRPKVNESPGTSSPSGRSATSTTKPATTVITVQAVNVKAETATVRVDGKVVTVSVGQTFEKAFTLLRVEDGMATVQCGKRIEDIRVSQSRTFVR